MKHDKIIQELKPIFQGILGVDSAILYGSIARNEGTPQSDIDIAIVVNDQFQISNLEKVLRESSNPPERTFRVEMRDKLVCYYNELLIKVEVSTHTSLNSLSRNYTGSRIPNELVDNSILFDRSGDLVERLRAINGQGYREHSIEELVHKFMYEFDNSSMYHRRSDGYRSLYFYQIALHCLVQLINILVAENKLQFLPKNLLVNIVDDEERRSFYGLNGTMYLPESNDKKRALLNKLYEILKALEYEGLDDAKDFLEQVYERDRYWNLRPVKTFNSTIKWNNLVRSSSPSRMDEDSMKHLFSTYSVHTVIDLRAPREVEKQPYPNDVLSKINYVPVPLDPWNQPEWFRKSEYQQGNNHEIAYRFFALGCRDSLRIAFQELIKVPAGHGAVIHCLAGKDRTGIVCSILHLLTQADRSTIMTDYLASEADVYEWKIQLILDIIEQEGGVEQYLINCGLSEMELLTLKTRLGHA